MSHVKRALFTLPQRISRVSQTPGLSLKEHYFNCYSSALQQDDNKCFLAGKPSQQHTDPTTAVIFLKLKVFQPTLPVPFHAP